MRRALREKLEQEQEFARVAATAASRVIDMDAE
jgi:hypothetical protein